MSETECPLLPRFDMKLSEWADPSPLDEIGQRQKFSLDFFLPEQHEMTIYPKTHQSFERRL